MSFAATMLSTSCEFPWYFFMRSLVEITQFWIVYALVSLVHVSLPPTWFCIQVASLESNLYCPCRWCSLVARDDTTKELQLQSSWHWRNSSNSCHRSWWLAFPPWYFTKHTKYFVFETGSPSVKGLDFISRFCSGITSVFFPPGHPWLWFPWTALRPPLGNVHLSKHIYIYSIRENIYIYFFL